MTFKEFVKELQKRYPNCVGINHVDYDVADAECNEGEGDFIYEDGNIVIGRYIHEFKLYETAEKQCHVIRFCAYGIGHKYCETVDDYSLNDYNNFDYILLNGAQDIL